MNILQTFQENELITFFLVLGILVFLFANRKRIEPTEPDRYLLWSFIFYSISSVLTLAETLVWPVLFNHMEHLFILLHTVFFTVWIWLVIKRQLEGKT